MFIQWDGYQQWICSDICVEWLFNQYIYIYRVMGIYWNNPIPLAPETPPNWSQKTVEIPC